MMPQTELDKAIDRAAIIWCGDCGKPTRESEMLLQILHEEIDPLVTVEFELPVECWTDIHDTGEGDGRRLNIAADQAADFINRVAKRKE